MITFSGIDCAGKSTQIDIISKHFESNGIKHKIIWSRGGYTSWIEGFKTLIRPDKNYSEVERAEYRTQIKKSSIKSKLLLLASILDLIRFYSVVMRWIEFTGTIILCDRYIWDTYIDFKLRYKDIDFENWISWRILIYTMKKPRTSFIFVIPAEESMYRSTLKEEPFPENYEKRVLRIRRYEHEIKKNRWQHVIDGMQPLENVTENVLEKIELE